MLDPFLKWNEFAPLLRRAGFTGICNFPPLPEFDAEEERALTASEYTFKSEVDRLNDFAGTEFELLVVCTTEDCLTQADHRLQSGKPRYCLLEDIGSEAGKCGDAG